MVITGSFNSYYPMSLDHVKEQCSQNICPQDVGFKNACSTCITVPCIPRSHAKEWLAIYDAARKGDFIMEWGTNNYAVNLALGLRPL